MPYTINLTPPKSHAERYVALSQDLYGAYQPRYLLTADGASSPHITVVQFDCDQAVATQVWNKMREAMRQAQFEPFAPPFTGVAFVKGTGLYAGTTWIELSVDRGLPDSPIMKAHNAAIAALRDCNLNPLNASENRYRPHLTLARIALPPTLKTCPETLFDDPGLFQLEFGRSDEKWQYAESLDIFFPQISGQDKPRSF